MEFKEIKYASKTGAGYEHIYEIGNDVKTWPLRDAIRLTETKKVCFFTFKAGKAAIIEVRTKGWRKWLQTVSDGNPHNNLLALPPCRVRAA